MKELTATLSILLVVALYSVRSMLSSVTAPARSAGASSGAATENVLRTRGDSSLSTCKAFRATEASLGVGNGTSMVLTEKSHIYQYQGEGRKGRQNMLFRETHPTYSAHGNSASEVDDDDNDAMAPRNSRDPLYASAYAYALCVGRQWGQKMVHGSHGNVNCVGIKTITMNDQQISGVEGGGRGELGRGNKSGNRLVGHGLEKDIGVSPLPRYLSR